MVQRDIQRATVADVEALAELERLGFPLDQYSTARLRYLLTKANSSSYKIEVDGRVLAYIMVLWRKGTKVGHLYSLVTHPEFQGHGYGSRLLHTVEAEAAERGCKRLRLEVRADNDNAIRLYKARGYEAVQDLPGFYTDDAPGLRMIKRL